MLSEWVRERKGEGVSVSVCEGECDCAYGLVSDFVNESLWLIEWEREQVTEWLTKSLSGCECVS